MLFFFFISNNFMLYHFQGALYGSEKCNCLLINHEALWNTSLKNLYHPTLHPDLFTNSYTFQCQWHHFFKLVSSHNHNAS